MKTTVSVKGLRELDAALAEFSKSTARSIVRRALLKAAQPMADEAKRLAPVAAVDGGQLRNSIKVTTAKPPGHKSKAAFSAAMKAGATGAQAGAAQRAYNRENPGAFAEVFVAPDKLAQAWPQEVGTVNHPPQPYMRPAFEAKKDEAIEILATEIKAEIGKAAERARRKALRKKA